MRRIITKEHAIQIAKKLEAELRPRKRKAHDLYAVYHEGRRVAQFGIRRGSEKDKGHDHIPGQIFITPHNALRLAQCPMARKEWLEVLRNRGMIPEHE